MDCEGIVSKRLGSRYRSGRTKDWLKFKNADAPAVKREAEENLGPMSGLLLRRALRARQAPTRWTITTSLALTVRSSDAYSSPSHRRQGRLGHGRWPMDFRKTAHRRMATSRRAKPRCRRSRGVGIERGERLKAADRVFTSEVLARCGRALLDIGSAYFGVQLAVLVPLMSLRRFVRAWPLVCAG
jgi:hypothetical protein